MTPKQLERIAKAKGLEVKVSSPVGMARLPKQESEVSTSAPIRWAIEFSLPCRVVSESNRRQWVALMRRKMKQAEAFNAVKFTLGLHLLHNLTPCCVILTHVGPRMDKHDNLRSAFKKIADCIARWLGVDDDDPRVEWRYLQRLGPPGVEVRVESRELSGNSG